MNAAKPKGPQSGSAGPTRSKRFFTNVLWTWLGVATNLVNGFFLSPYVIRKLGPVGYGVWTLLFSLIDYYGFIDFGFRSALVYYTARFRAQGQPQKINELISSILFYYTLGSSLLLLVVILLSKPITEAFDIPSHFQNEFAALIILAAMSWVIGVNAFAACLEGFQRFDFSSRIYIAAQVLRAVGSIALLALGYGLFALGLNYLFLQAFGTVLCYFALRKAFPSLKLSSRFVKLSVLKETASYGIHTFVGNIGSKILGQSAPILIGLFRSPVYVGYYNLPGRLLQYTADLVSRVGMVTTSNATELAAKGEREPLVRLSTYANRYCFMLFVPLVIFLLIYGKEFFLLWVGAEYVRYSIPLVPVLALGTAFAIAGQFNSGAMLFSLRKHKEYGRAVLAEALINVLGLIVVIPRYGILGAAWVSVTPMLLIRGLYSAWLVCRSLDLSLGRYLFSIYGRPLFTAIPLYALVQWMKPVVLPGRNWVEVIGAGCLIAAAYFLVASFTCLDPRHRELLRQIAAERLRTASA